MFNRPIRDPARIDRVLAAIRAKWVQDPDLRLMQLLSNDLGGGDHYYLEDDDLLKALLRPTADKS